MIEFATNLAACYVGLIFYIVWVSRDKIFTPSYTLRQHFRESKKRWAWGLTVLFMTAIVYQVLPELIPSLLESVGVTISVEENTGIALFGLLGIQVGKIIRNNVKKG